MRNIYRRGPPGHRLVSNILAASTAYWPRDISPLFYLAASLIVACLGLGGGTRSGFLSDAILQLLAIPVLIAALWALLDSPLSKSARATLGFCLALAALPLAQLLPLPPWLWTLLPGRSSIAEAYEIVDKTIPWNPISVSPEATWLSGLALIPPLAIFLSTLFLSYRDRRRLSLVVLSFGILCVLVGLLQVTQGPTSSLRFYEFTNQHEAVGFFANRNHFAALIYSLILLAAAWTAHATLLAGQANLDELQARSMVAALASFTLIGVLLVGESMARSRAGLGLTMMALFAAIIIGVLDRRASTMRLNAGSLAGNKLVVVAGNKLFLGAIALAIVLVVQFALYKILGRLDDPFGARIAFFQRTVEAAIAYLPFGSGLGTFVPVYASFEQPEDALANTYANHAHNDIVQVSLETGLPGICLIALFALWFVRRAILIWKSAPAGVSDIDWSLARAATIIVVLLLTHSLVDYPLHTGAIMAIVTFACGLMTEPVTKVAEQNVTPPMKRHTRRKDKAKRPSISEPTAASPQPPILLPQHSPWDVDIVWPEEWSRSSTEPLNNQEAPSSDTSTND